jgi:acetyltransferase-like isoleucine patch superfamily enzyme
MSQSPSAPSDMVSLLEKPRSKSWHRLSESLAIALVGWMPSKVGMLLRHAVYSRLFGRLGNASEIAKGVRFYRLQQIELGNDVFIASGCHLIGSDDGSKVILDSGVYLHEQVRIRSLGIRGEVLLKHRVMLDRGVDINSCENGQIEIDQETSVGAYTCIAGPGHISIGEYCLIASHCGIYANNHIFTDLSRPIMMQGVTTEGIVIESDCWLGTGVKVLDGVRIGQGCVIGAGAVVTKNIPPYSIAVGVPAKVIGTRKSVEANEQVNLLHQVSS